MFRELLFRSVVAAAAASLASSAVAEVNKSMTFTKPINETDATVTVEVEPGPDVPVTIPPNTSAEQKRNLIRDALQARGYDVTDNGAGGNQLTIRHLTDGTSVSFRPGTTGEKADKIVSDAVVMGRIGFEGPFDPFELEFGQPAVFTAGIVTDVGELAVRVSAQELDFQTEGPIICQALFQRLAPRAPQYGAQINYAGDRLEVYFDPAYTVTQGGIVFGTDSASPGCLGEVQSGAGTSNPCPEDIDGDGSVGLGDLSRLLASFGKFEDQAGFDAAADLDGDGSVGLSDLAQLLTAFGRHC